MGVGECEWEGRRVGGGVGGPWEGVEGGSGEIMIALMIILAEVWDSVLSELEEQRSKLSLPYLPCNQDVCRQFGLTHPLVVQLVEQLPHANRCSNYHFSYHKPSEMTSWRAHVSVWSMMTHTIEAGY